MRLTTTAAGVLAALALLAGAAPAQAVPIDPSPTHVARTWHPTVKRTPARTWHPARCQSWPRPTGCSAR